MKTSEETPLFAIERREAIIKLIEERSKVLVPELCDHFGVSPATIRTDLRELEAVGRLKRTHGGAVPAGKAGFEPNTVHKQVERVLEKRRIAEQAARYVEDGDTILLDSGTTMMELAARLAGRTNLTVVTNDLRIAGFLEANASATVVLVGGTVRRGFHCALGPMAVAALSGLSVDRAFIASNAVSIDKGFTTPGFDHAELKKKMIEIASETLVLADSAKLGRISFVRFAEFEEVDRFVTDKGMGAETIRAIREKCPEMDLVVV